MQVAVTANFVGVKIKLARQRTGGVPHILGWGHGQRRRRGFLQLQANHRDSSKRSARSGDPSWLLRTLGLGAEAGPQAKAAVEIPSSRARKW